MDLRVIVGKDGEEYINSKDLGVALQEMVYTMPVPSISALDLIRRFVIEVITARR